MYVTTYVTAIVLGVALCFGAPAKKANTCGYDVNEYIYMHPTKMIVSILSILGM